MLKLKLQFFGHLMQKTDSLKRPWCWERLKVGGEGDARGWDGWMASLTRWIWVWASSGSWWWTGRPGVLRSMGSQGLPQIFSKFRNFCFLYICKYYLVVVLSRFSHVWLFVNPWTVNRQAPLSMGFCRQEFWNGLPCPLPGDLPDSGIERASLMSGALAGEFLTIY